MAEVTITAAEVFETPSGWRWVTYGGNGERLGWGESYERSEDAAACLEAHLRGAPDVPIARVELDQSVVDIPALQQTVRERDDDADV